MTKLDLAVEKMRQQGYRPFCPDHNDGRALRELRSDERMILECEHEQNTLDAIIGAGAVGVVLGFILGLMFAVWG